MTDSATKPPITPKRTARGFGDYGAFHSRWHDLIQVAESSIAFEGACVHVFAQAAYGNGSSPHLHLTYADAKRLRDLLDVFVRAADAGETCEAPAGEVAEEVDHG